MKHQKVTTTLSFFLLFLFFTQSTFAQNCRHEIKHYLPSLNEAKSFDRIIDSPELNRSDAAELIQEVLQIVEENEGKVAYFKSERKVGFSHSKVLFSIRATEKVIEIIRKHIDERISLLEKED